MKSILTSLCILMCAVLFDGCTTVQPGNGGDTIRLAKAAVTSAMTVWKGYVAGVAGTKYEVSADDHAKAELAYASAITALNIADAAVASGNADDADKAIEKATVAASNLVELLVRLQVAGVFDKRAAPATGALPGKYWDFMAR